MILSEIWSKTVTDGHPLDCITIPLGQEHVPSTPDLTWVSKHVQQSRYSLQIAKCFDSNCCKPFVTDWPKMFPTQFCPPPLVYKYSENGMVAVEPEKYFKDPKKYKFAPLSVRIILEKYPDAAKKYLKAPFHLYCPSMQDKLENGICKSCGHYGPSRVAMMRHRKCHQPSTIEEKSTTNDSESDSEMFRNDQDVIPSSSNSGRMPVFNNIFNIFKSPFVGDI